jgi:hypothetical protein
MTSRTPILTLTPGTVSLADLERVFRNECAVRLLRPPETLLFTG